MTPLKPTLTFHCPEKWDNMKVGLLSRHCENCQRDVQDFTKMSREEILQFLLTNRDNKVCGRIHKSQLDYNHHEILVTIHSYLQKTKSSNLSFYLLSLSAIMMLGCSQPELVDKSQMNKTSTTASNEPGVDAIIEPDTLSVDFENMLLGMIYLEDSLESRNAIKRVAEVMPEFPGGFENYLTYITKNLKYPESEQKQKIEGTIVVSFIVEADGKIKDPIIIKSISRSINFDREVLRLIKEMPDWKPGQQDGQNIEVEITLPIRFEL